MLIWTFISSLSQRTFHDGRKGMRTITPVTLKMFAGAREPSVHAHFIFRFENGQGSQSFFLLMTKNTAETKAQWPIGYGVGLRIKGSSVRIRPWPLRWVLGQGFLLPQSQGEAFTLASISYLAILVKYILAKKKKKKKKKTRQPQVRPTDD